MKPRINCITFAVDDLKKSLAFYRDGLGLPITGAAEDTDHLVFELQGGLYLVLVVRNDFAGFTKFVNQTDAEKGASESILSYFASNKEEVDAILKQAEAASGIPSTEAKEQSWGYAGFFTDPDGHMWEVVWNSNFREES
jgi:predicted lactoylglutathione lyase